MFWGETLIANHEDSGAVGMNKWKLIVLVGGACALLWQLSNSVADDRDLMFTSGRGKNARPSESRRPLSEDELVQLRKLGRAQEFDAKTSLDEGRSIHPDLMLSVIDNSIGIRFEEREAYLRILRLAHDVPLRWLERYAEELRNERREAVPSYKSRRFKDFPQFVDLFTRPDLYRGRPVTLHGIMRKLTKFDVGQNKLDLDDVYEGWVYTPDSQGNPSVVVFTSKSEDLPVKGDIQEEVRFTGYFFKMYGYDGHDAARKAPLILAGEVERIPQPLGDGYQHVGLEWYVLSTMGFLLGLYAIWQMNRRTFQVRPAPEIEPDFRHFPPLEHPAQGPHLPHSLVETEDS
jgi:hypothetical protein